MPELPEVESIRQSILPFVIGRSISRADILTPGVWLNQSLPETGWQIDDIRRRGKYLLFALTRDVQKACLVVHLRMTGRLLLQTEDLTPARHTHVRLRLEPGEAAGSDRNRPLWLVFHDTRRFGRIWLLPGSLEGQPEGLANLGPEPLDPGFTAASLAIRLARHARSSLKAALLNQTTVAGLGNIYADESLFAAGLYPGRAAGSLTEQETARLASAIVRVLHQAIECQGTSLRDYVNGWNQQGSFQNCLMVYGRSGQPCRQCGAAVRKMRLAGRTTCWCPDCQPPVTEAAKIPNVEEILS